MEWNAAKTPALMAEVVDTAVQYLVDYFVAAQKVLEVAEQSRYWAVDLLTAGFLETWESVACSADLNLVATEQV